MWSGIKVRIEFWNVDKLVVDIQKYLFDEHIFGAEIQRVLRKALHFINKSDYCKKYAERSFQVFIWPVRWLLNMLQRQVSIKLELWYWNISLSNTGNSCWRIIKLVSHHMQDGYKNFGWCMKIGIRNIMRQFDIVMREKTEFPFIIQ